MEKNQCGPPLQKGWGPLHVFSANAEIALLLTSLKNFCF